MNATMRPNRGPTKKVSEHSSEQHRYAVTSAGDSTPFQEDARQLHLKIHRAIIQQNIDEIGPYAYELRKFWTIALTRRYRDGFRVVNGLFLQAAETAQLFAEDGTSVEALRRWACQWEYLGESGALVEKMDEEWRVSDDLTSVFQRFHYAEKTLTFLRNHGLASTEQLKEIFRQDVLQQEGEDLVITEHTPDGERRISARLNNHLRRLMNYQLIDRAAHGMYHLTARGFAVVDRIKHDSTAQRDEITTREDVLKAKAKELTDREAALVIKENTAKNTKQECSTSIEIHNDKTINSNSYNPISLMWLMQTESRQGDTSFSMQQKNQ